mmetsp:Transcript_105936/g.287541  ORF Transcript_105936/g.287541 Transcript_105936/m.287541 type:complete len:225 (-) Transcript_105936:1150-1824(-)
MTTSAPESARSRGAPRAQGPHGAQTRRGRTRPLSFPAPPAAPRAARHPDRAMRSTARAAAACATERAAPLQAPRARLGASSTGSTSSSLQEVVAAPSSPRSQSPGAASTCCLRSSSDAVALPEDQRPGAKADASSATCGYGQSAGKALWRNSAKSRPCRGTSPPLRPAMSRSLASAASGGRRMSGDAVRLRTSDMMRPGVAAGAWILPSSSFSRPSQSLRQHTE